MSGWLRTKLFCICIIRAPSPPPKRFQYVMGTVLVAPDVGYAAHDAVVRPPAAMSAVLHKNLRLLIRCSSDVLHRMSSQSISCLLRFLRSETHLVRYPQSSNLHPQYCDRVSRERVLETV